MTLGADSGIWLLALGVALAIGLPRPAQAQTQTFCSVLDPEPCAPTYCSVFNHGPCFPNFGSPIGQDLRLTVDSRSQNDRPHHPMDENSTIRDLFASLRQCWIPPDRGEAQPGMEISVRFSFRRDGALVGTPRFTYSTPNTAPKTLETYRKAVMDTLDRCTPMPFGRGMGGAIAGRPIAIRFVDNRPAEAGSP